MIQLVKSRIHSDFNVIPKDDIRYLQCQGLNPVSENDNCEQ